MGEFPQLVMVTRDSRGMGWSGSILRGRCDEGMTLLRCASVAYKESNRVANAARPAPREYFSRRTPRYRRHRICAPARRRRQAVRSASPILGEMVSIKVNSAFLHFTLQNRFPAVGALLKHSHRSNIRGQYRSVKFAKL